MYTRCQGVALLGTTKGANMYYQIALFSLVKFAEAHEWVMPTACTCYDSTGWYSFRSWQSFVR